MRISRLLILLLLAMVAAATAGCSAAPLSADVDGHMVLLPRVLRSGETMEVGFTLFVGQELGQGEVQVSFLDGGRAVAKAGGRVNGKGTVALEVPPVEAGEYQVEVSGPGFQESASVRVESGTVVYLETDKPAYAPGQSLKMRVLTLDAGLKPASADVVVEVRDAKGIKVLGRTVSPDEFGMASLELPLSVEPNLGTWTLTATFGESTARVAVRVEEYTEPPYEVVVETPQSWFLVDEPLVGKVTALYDFGKAVKGQLKVSAWRYAGEWAEYATYVGEIDGSAEFRLDPAVFASDVAEAGGQGNIRLEVSVEEEAAAREEAVTRFLTVAEAALDVRFVSQNSAFKPGLPFDILIATQSPVGESVEAEVALDCIYYDQNDIEVGREHKDVRTKKGAVLVRTTPPAEAARAQLFAASGTVSASKEVVAAYSPSGSFVHVEQFGLETLHTGDAAVFSVYSSSGQRDYFYEVVSKGRVVLSDRSSGDLQFRVTPAMEGSCRLLVYQLLPDGEIAADSMPFTVEGTYPQTVTASFGQKQATPGDSVEVRLRTEGRAKVGLAIVDRPDLASAAHQLDVQQVFAGLDALYLGQEGQEAGAAGSQLQQPAHPGAEEVFADAGLLVLSDKTIPAGQTPPSQAGSQGQDSAQGQDAAQDRDVAQDQGSAGVEPAVAAGRYLPVTWIWEEVETGADGKATLSFDVPDAITTWGLRALAVSPSEGLGIAEASLEVFRPLRLSAKLPSTAIRGEEFSLAVSVANYLNTPQEFGVEIQPQAWFELLDSPQKTVLVGANNAGSVEFRMRPVTLGIQVVEIEASSGQVSDTLSQGLTVEPEGVPREKVDNLVLAAGSSASIDLSAPSEGLAAGSVHAYISLSGSPVAESLEGLGSLLRMPAGCGEQNLALFAPGVSILTYLGEAGRLKADVQAASAALLAGAYQRELTFRRSDGSFSPFGEKDQEGSLFLTAFALGAFSQATAVAYVDQSVTSQAAEWIRQRQKEDGSFEAVGFVPQPGVMGGERGREALTAYVAVALLRAGVQEAADRALSFLEERLDQIADTYTLAITSYALEVGGSPRAPDALAKLAAGGAEDDDGLHWSASQAVAGQEAGVGAPFAAPSQTLDVETTGYALLALSAAGDRDGAAKAARWLVGRRNASGGFGSTQDTVVALQALSEFAAAGAQETDLTIHLTGDGVDRQVRITPDNQHVNQIVEVPAGIPLTLRAEGEGEAVVQSLVHYNSTTQSQAGAFTVGVGFGASELALDQTVGVTVDLAFNPPEPHQTMNAGMVVVEVGVPTGLTPLRASLEQLLVSSAVKRYELYGDKVVLYLDDMSPGQQASYAFEMRGSLRAQAKAVPVRAYAYYIPEWQGEAMTGELSVR